MRLNRMPFLLFLEFCILLYFSLIRMSASSLYKLVDIGANLGHPSFKHDYMEMLRRAKKAGIVKLIITGVNESSTEEAAKAAAKEPGFLYYTAGIHPHDAKDFVEGQTLELFRKHLIGNKHCIAVGECGLDFNRNFSPREQQLNVFEEQVKLACELQKPLFIHEREASSEMISILTKHRHSLPPAVIHCFTGTLEEAKQYMDMGLYIGLTGFLWKDRSENGVKRALREGIIRMDRLLLETDAPFMFPKVNDKKIESNIRAQISEEALSLHKHCSFQRNEPCSLAAICELIAAYMGCSPAELASATTANALRIFGLGDIDQSENNSLDQSG